LLTIVLIEQTLPDLDHPQEQQQDERRDQGELEQRSGRYRTPSGAEAARGGRLNRMVASFPGAPSFFIADFALRVIGARKQRPQQRIDEVPGVADRDLRQNVRSAAAARQLPPPAGMLLNVNAPSGMVSVGVACLIASLMARRR